MPNIVNPFLRGQYAAQTANESADQAQLGGLARLLQMRGMLSDQAEKQAAYGREAAYREGLARLGPDAKDEDVIKLGISSGAIDPKSLTTLLQNSQNKQIQMQTTREATMARLSQAAQQFEQNYQLRLRSATTQEERLALAGQREAFKQQLQSEAARLAGAQANYNFGFTPNAPPTPTAAAPRLAGLEPSGSAPAPAAGGLAGILAGRPQAEQDAIRQVASAPGLLSVEPSSNTAPYQPPVEMAPTAPQTPASLYGPEGRFPQVRVRSEPEGVSTAAVVAQPTAAGQPRPLTLADAPAELTPRKKQEWLMKNSATSGSAAMGPDAIKIAGWEKLLYGTDPKGMGTASAQQRAQVADERARIGKSLGLSDTEMAMLPQDNRVKMKAVDQLTRWAATVGRGAEKLALDLDVAIDYAGKLPLTTLQLVNRGVIAGMKEFNNPDANAYATALNSVRLEYGRLMSGPTSNAMLPVEAMKIGNELISKGVDVPALREIGVQMKRDAANTITATNSQISGLRGSIGAPAPGAAFMGQPKAAPASRSITDQADEILKRGTQTPGLRG